MEITKKHIENLFKGFIFLLVLTLTISTALADTITATVQVVSSIPTPAGGGNPAGYLEKYTVYPRAVTLMDRVILGDQVVFKEISIKSMINSAQNISTSFICENVAICAVNWCDLNVIGDINLLAKQEQKLAVTCKIPMSAISDKEYRIFLRFKGEGNEIKDVLLVMPLPSQKIMDEIAQKRADDERKKQLTIMGGGLAGISVALYFYTNGGKK